jgi:hypothetical protein
MSLDRDRLVAEWMQCERCHQLDRELVQTDSFDHVGCGGHVVRFAILLQPPDLEGDIAAAAAAYLKES